MTAWNQSRVKSWRRCQKQHAFRYDYAPVSKELIPNYPSLPLKRGGWCHELQEVYHREWAEASGFDSARVWGEESTEDGEYYIPRETWQDRHDYLTEEFNGMFEEEREKYGDLPNEAYRLFRAYLRRWRDDSDNFRVAPLHDGGPGIEFVVEVPLTRWGIADPFKGRIDLLVEDLSYGGLWIWDAKWVKSLPSPDDRMMSPQVLMYAWAMKKLGYDVRGFLFNYGRTKPPAIPDVLKSGYLTTKAKLDSDLYTYVMAMQENHPANWRKLAKTYYATKLQELKGREVLWFRRERVPVENERIKRALVEYLYSIKQIEKRGGFGINAPRTWTFSCKWDCDFTDLCVAEFTGLDIKPLIKRSYHYEEERYYGKEGLVF